MNKEKGHAVITRNFSGLNSSKIVFKLQFFLSCGILIVILFLMKADFLMIGFPSQFNNAFYLSSVFRLCPSPGSLIGTHRSGWPGRQC